MCQSVSIASRDRPPTYHCAANKPERCCDCAAHASNSSCMSTSPLQSYHAIRRGLEEDSNQSINQTNEHRIRLTITQHYSNNSNTISRLPHRLKSNQTNSPIQIQSNNETRHRYTYKYKNVYSPNTKNQMNARVRCPKNNAININNHHHQIGRSKERPTDRARTGQSTNILSRERD